MGDLQGCELTDPDRPSQRSAGTTPTGPRTPLLVSPRLSVSSCRRRANSFTPSLPPTSSPGGHLHRSESTTTQRLCDCCRNLLRLPQACPIVSITRSHGSVTSVVRATRQVNGRKQTYISNHTTPLNRQSQNIAHVLTSTISPHMPHLVKITQGVTSPHIAKFTTHFFFISLYAKTFHGLELRPLNRF